MRLLKTIAPANTQFDALFTDGSIGKRHTRHELAIIEGKHRDMKVIIADKTGFDGLGFDYEVGGQDDNFHVVNVFSGQGSRSKYIDTVAVAGAMDIDHAVNLAVNLFDSMEASYGVFIPNEPEKAVMGLDGLSTDELRSLAFSADTLQKTLSQDCQNKHFLPIMTQKQLLTAQSQITHEPVMWDNAYRLLSHGGDDSQLLIDLQKNDTFKELTTKYTMLDALADMDIAELGFDALMDTNNRLQLMADRLFSAMSKASVDGISTTNVTLSKPFKRQGVANVAMQFDLSDGQTISIFFHNPDADPKKLSAQDVMVSWKWLLNKRDITAAVSPKQGDNVKLPQLAMRMMRIAAKNSKRFATAQATKEKNNQALIDAENMVNTKQATLDQLNQDIADLTQKIEEAGKAASQTNIRQKLIVNPTSNSLVEPSETDALIEKATEVVDKDIDKIVRDIRAIDKKAQNSESLSEKTYLLEQKNNLNQKLKKARLSKFDIEDAITEFYKNGTPFNNPELSELFPQVTTLLNGEAGKAKVAEEMTATNSTADNVDGEKDLQTIINDYNAWAKKGYIDPTAKNPLILTMENVEKFANGGYNGRFIMNSYKYHGSEISFYQELGQWKKRLAKAVEGVTAGDTTNTNDKYQGISDKIAEQDKQLKEALDNPLAEKLVKKTIRIPKDMVTGDDPTYYIENGQTVFKAFNIKIIKNSTGGNYAYTEYLGDDGQWWRLKDNAIEAPEFQAINDAARELWESVNNQGNLFGDNQPTPTTDKAEPTANDLPLDEIRNEYKTRFENKDFKWLEKYKKQLQNLFTIRIENVQDALKKIGFKESGVGYRMENSDTMIHVDGIGDYGWWTTYNFDGAAEGSVQDWLEGTAKELAKKIIDTYNNSIGSNTDDNAERGQEPTAISPAVEYSPNNPYAQYANDDPEVKKNADDWESRKPLTEQRLADMNALAESMGYVTYIESRHANMGVFQAEKEAGNRHVSIDGRFINNDADSAKETARDFTLQMQENGEPEDYFYTNDLEEALKKGSDWLEQLNTELEPINQPTLSPEEKKLNNLIKERDMMKDINKITRMKISDDEKVAKIMEFGIKQDAARTLATGEGTWDKRAGFAPYQLTNLNNRIKTLQAKVDAMKKADEINNSLGGEDMVLAGVTIVLNKEADRIQLDFPSKPSREVISVLKSNGWKWSPTNQVWQRQITENAMKNARKMIETYADDEGIDMEEESSPTPSQEQVKEDSNVAENAHPNYTQDDIDYLNSIINGDIDPLDADMDKIIAIGEKDEIDPLFEQALAIINDAEDKATAGV